MQATPTAIADVFLLEPKVFGDDRGFFFECFNERTFRELTGAEVQFVQDNQSGSVKNVLRGLHYQIQQPQGKLIRVLAGEIWDVALDVRRDSPTFGKWVGYHLSAKNRHMLWIPAGLAHGFLALGEWNEVHYKATDFWAPQYERSILWNDPALEIEWPLNGAEPTLSNKDRTGVPLAQAEVYETAVANRQAATAW